MTDKTALVITLKSQHRALQSDLSLAKTNAAAGLMKDVFENLNSFKADLTTHLKLENGTFYPDYLQETTAKGGDIQKIKGFIADMIEIGNKVNQFLAKFDTLEKLTANQSSFVQELPVIISTLNMRIELEEEGIYDIYAAS